MFHIGCDATKRDIVSGQRNERTNEQMRAHMLLACFSLSIVAIFHTIISYRLHTDFPVFSALQWEIVGF